jgi:hypothetical protein
LIARRFGRKAAKASFVLGRALAASLRGSRFAANRPATRKDHFSLTAMFGDASRLDPHR